ncbi:lipocalin [Seongchinamella sediminis]|uniref:Outer membrane lipoprotein Blc n=1 Tax=Seongchinamella sediminis TaxID=2283635 RepID=A0A3L7E299_9GAMM|nr:lipocalin family protein [Seongchinamella sediminis]RLQ22463.1 lipocalin [Seongchinamella sediminis]
MLNSTVYAAGRIAAVTLMLACLQLLTGCTGLPDGIAPVSDFEADAYMGRWYEIARLDHSFERGQSNITADYALQDDGTVSVLNRGFDDAEDEWRQASAVARFAGAADVGHLEVSFFQPIYASYVIFALAGDGSYAYVTGHKRDYLWLLARSPRVGEDVKRDFVQRVSDLGFDTRELIWVDQDKN